MFNCLSTEGLHESKGKILCWQILMDQFLHFNNKPSSCYQLKLGTFSLSSPPPPQPPSLPLTDCLRWNKCEFQFWPVRLPGTWLCSMESCAQVSVDYDITNTIRRSLQRLEKIIRRRVETRVIFHLESVSCEAQQWHDFLFLRVFAHINFPIFQWDSDPIGVCEQNIAVATLRLDTPGQT